jgi:uncharacterized peroxidase-related enzyme
MPRIQPVEPAEAPNAAKGMLETAEKKMGRVPNLLKTLAHSPAALQMYMADAGALATASLSAAQQEQIALAVAEANGCHYCLSAHTMKGKGAGLSDADVEAARRGEASQASDAAILRFAMTVLEKKGWVGEAAIEEARSAGLSDAEIIEVVAVVVHNIFTNYMNHVIEPEIDFPKVAPPATVGA